MTVIGKGIDSIWQERKKRSIVAEIFILEHRTYTLLPFRKVKIVP